ncbi:preprotein translocase subunit SecE [Candidatus Uhrbacteria bacterium RIFCSPLOWO2_12_FULL_46_10]|uniref:Protein translocase subunit SecE n=1 Tax=Candidatus Uhrbacteria bacterium RIFCSPLOWO2_01_FULL_47_25 TaxID=1802402 RepID=A0A1F7UT63_9BACT|nr:MAG: preprotein translocase subunit SecE [Candidatus Uhrbacteria bacterium RIFCSPHIGHO2_01_FULL_46_23]OGL69466.1 MAG: preprotein translocase subunit SecE [Candidatus Uhrbacteria bacterium RIFCSPHIGHO2_02_FULL_47_29]OGL80908.1 MAG: preprotein translocase subunit SecE [Candidatus Uhrbacteria bacterium RIFCSPLOWO2_01_FULL_47_25]OGL84741.1 MAG: preprotein translocase subunit SecE [Candidatus Uhrbacteria bacterium RIFCSPLOWO2_02_FULL_46_19]OGL91433.1 MAG: preprotein translocase subunit SecE [Cand
MYSFRNNPIINYFKTSYHELVKVTWPTRQEATRHALLVIGLSLATAAFFGIVDYILSRGLEKLIVK